MNLNNVIFGKTQKIVQILQIHSKYSVLLQILMLHIKYSRIQEILYELRNLFLMSKFQTGISVRFAINLKLNLSKIFHQQNK